VDGGGQRADLVGARDTKTQPEHSQRIFAALRAPKELILVPNRGHRRPLTDDVWREIDAWLDAGLDRPAAR